MSVRTTGRRRWPRAATTPCLARRPRPPAHAGPRGRGRVDCRSARGQATVEFAFTVIILLSLVLGLFDTVRALVVQQALSEMAWAGARYASLNLAADPSASSSLEPQRTEAIVSRARAAAFGLDASAATIRVQLPDGGHRPGQRVRVQVSYSYVPVSTQFIGGRAMDMSSSDTLLILPGSPGGGGVGAPPTPVIP